MKPTLAYLKRDRVERFNLKRAWFVNAWRIVDKDGKDLVQPWCDTAPEAKALAAHLNITIVGDFDDMQHE